MWVGVMVVGVNKCRVCTPTYLCVTPRNRHHKAQDVTAIAWVFANICMTHRISESDVSSMFQQAVHHIQVAPTHCMVQGTPPISLHVHGNTHIPVVQDTHARTSLSVCRSLPIEIQIQL